MKDNCYLGLKAWDMGFDAHLTVLFLGKRSEQKRAQINNWIWKDQLGHREFVVKRESIIMVGPNHNIPAVKVIPEVSLELFHKGCKRIWGNVSQYPWNPHITLKFKPNQTIHIPEVIKLSHFDLY